MFSCGLWEEKETILLEYYEFATGHVGKQNQGKIRPYIFFVIGLIRHDLRLFAWQYRNVEL